jgi:peptidyl-dipeptidase Dcp
MKRLLFIIMPLSMYFAGCKQTVVEDNPFFVEWDTPFGAPPFDKIQDDHFLPAYEEAIRQHKAEIDAIISNPDVQILKIPSWRMTMPEL